MKYEGEFFRAPKKLHDELIFFVHFYGGSKKALRRHIEWVNSEGFDAFAFDLLGEASFSNIPLTSNLKFGLKHQYADQIESLLNEISGEKIVFAFSNPAAGAIEALSRRRCHDVKVLICDSGPSGKFIESVYNLYSGERKYSMPRSLVMTGFLSFFWGLKLNAGLEEELKTFPENFPVLSVIGWKDTLIPRHHIEAVFENQSHLDWRKLSLPEGSHLNGLRDFPEEYKTAVMSFLKPHLKSKKLHGDQKAL
jgi:hypothetical protein